MVAFLKGLAKRVKNIEDRNKKVELDKAWEVSYIRRFILVAFTYVSIGFYLQAIGVGQAWLHAIVPSIAFMLSTLTMPFFKKMWIRNKN